METREEAPAVTQVRGDGGQSRTAFTEVEEGPLLDHSYNACGGRGKENNG